MNQVERDKMINEINNYRLVHTDLPTKYKLWLWEQAKIRFTEWKEDPKKEIILECVICRVSMCDNCMWEEVNGRCLNKDKSDLYSRIIEADTAYNEFIDNEDTEELRNNLIKLLDKALESINKQIEKYTSELEKESA